MRHYCSSRKLCQKLVSLLCPLTFLLRSRDKDVGTLFRSSLSLTSSFHIILRKTNQTLLRERIIKIHVVISTAFRHSYFIFTWDFLAFFKSRILIFCITSLIIMLPPLPYSRLKVRKIRSIHHPQKQTLRKQRTVINLSSSKLTEVQILVLSKGFNFAVTPKIILVVSIISIIEPALYKIDQVISDDIRIKIE